MKRVRIGKRHNNKASLVTTRVRREMGKMRKGSEDITARLSLPSLN